MLGPSGITQAPRLGANFTSWRTDSTSPQRHIMLGVVDIDPSQNIFLPHPSFVFVLILHPHRVMAVDKPWAQVPLATPSGEIETLANDRLAYI